MRKAVNDAAGEIPGPDRPGDELENYRRLVDLQSQIVDLARRNSEAERSYRVLRDRLARQGLRRSQGPIRKVLLGLLERMRNRKAPFSQTMRGEGGVTMPLPDPSPNNNPVPVPVTPSNHSL